MARRSAVASKPKPKAEPKPMPKEGAMFLVDATHFATLLKQVYKSASVRTALPILESVHVEVDDGKGSLTASDGSNWHRVAFTPSRVTREGSFCLRLVPMVADFLVEAGAVEVLFDQQDHSVLISIGAAQTVKLDLMVLPSEEFPEFPIPGEGAKCASWTKETTAQASEAFACVEHALSDDSSRIQLTGAYLAPRTTVDKKKVPAVLVTTDTHRMMVVHHDFWEWEPCIVPHRAVAFITKLEGPVTVTYEKGRCFWLSGEGWDYCATLIGGAFPDFMRVVPQQYSRVFTADAGDFKKHLRMLMPLARDNANRVTFDWQGAEVVMSARSEDKGTMKIVEPVISKNDGLEFSFNGRYFQQALKALACEGFRVEMTEKSRPAVIRPTDKEDRYAVVMPMAMG